MRACICCTNDVTTALTDNSQGTAQQWTWRVTQYCPDSALLLRMLYCSSALWVGMDGNEEGRVGMGGVGTGGVGMGGVGMGGIGMNGIGMGRVGQTWVG